MERTVPLIAGDYLGTIGEATVNAEVKIVSLKFRAGYDRFATEHDLYSYEYKDLPEPHVLIRPIPAVEKKVDRNMKAIHVTPATFDKIEKEIDDVDKFADLMAWYYEKMGVFAYPLFFITERILENGDRIPPRAMLWTHLSTNFEGQWTKGDWFEITPKAGMEVYF
jgi:hypothetical protein